MKTFTVSEARKRLVAILKLIERGQEVAITKRRRPIALITHPAVSKYHGAVPPPGFLKAQGWAVKMADDWDAVPEGFEEY
jgi:antitoxin (DNA-binding transcriptional repressor) of toxin-antitoxin stability system